MIALGITILSLSLATLAACAGPRSTNGEPSLSPGQKHYNEGDYAAALPLLEQEAAATPTGRLLYQVAFCRHAQREGPSDPAALWGEARSVLERELGEPGGVTVERLYYLTVISDALEEFDAMRTYARRAVDEIENGPDPNALGAEDWFRLGRLHDFLDEPSGSEASYRRAVSAFTREPGSNPVYRALSLAMVADLDFVQGRYDAAASGYDTVLEILPETGQVNPYQHGLALLAAGRFEDALARFGDDRDPATMTESQYAADLARKAEAAGPLTTADSNSNALSGLSLPALDLRIEQAARDYRASRDRYSYRPGDPLSAELAMHQQRFTALVSERLLRTRQIQDYCLEEGIADLVRR
jgi:tetratricopeptide (TPR) repeat protein